MSGVLPAPLIIFSTFVGYIAGGLAGALAMTLGIFLPAFVFPIFLHRQLVAVAENDRLHPFLLGVAAAVIGLIAAVTVEILEDKRCRRLHGTDSRWRLRCPQSLALETDRRLRHGRGGRGRRDPSTHRRLSCAAGDGQALTIGL